MIYKKRKIIIPDISYQRIDFNSFASGMKTDIDENLLPQKIAAMSFNFSSKDGALREGIGFRVLHLPKGYKAEDGEREIKFTQGEKIIRTWFFRYFDGEERIKLNGALFFTEDKQFKVIPLISRYNQTCFPLSITGFNHENPSVMNYRLNGDDVIIITSSKDSLKVWYPDLVDVCVDFADAPKILSCCLHYERLFAIDSVRPDRLWFSDDLDPTNWNVSSSEAGFIEMLDERGMMIKVISFMDYVFVFREYGIARISAYGDQSDFSVSQLFTSSGNISAGSIAVCGDKIVFLARDGLHIFNGSTTQKITLGIEKLYEDVPNENTSSAYMNGKYYLACKMNFDDDNYIGCEKTNEYINNALLVLDLNSGEFEIVRGVDISCVCAFLDGHFSKVAVCFNGVYNLVGEICKDGCFLGRPLEKVWSSPRSNFGYPNRKKVIKEISVQTMFPIILRINCDGKNKEFNIKGSEKASKIYPKVKGENIQFSFISKVERAFISRPQIVYGVV